MCVSWDGVQVEQAFGWWSSYSLVPLWALQGPKSRRRWPSLSWGHSRKLGSSAVLRLLGAGFGPCSEYSCSRVARAIACGTKEEGTDLEQGGLKRPASSLWSLVLTLLGPPVMSEAVLDTMVA